MQHEYTHVDDFIFILRERRCLEFDLSVRAYMSLEGWYHVYPSYLTMEICYMF